MNEQRKYFNVSILVLIKGFYNCLPIADKCEGSHIKKNPCNIRLEPRLVFILIKKFSVKKGTLPLRWVSSPGPFDCRSNWRSNRSIGVNKFL